MTNLPKSDDQIMLMIEPWQGHPTWPTRFLDDMMIATIAQAHSLVLAVTHTPEFSRASGLQF